MFVNEQVITKKDLRYWCWRLLTDSTEAQKEFEVFLKEQNDNSN